MLELAASKATDLTTFDFQEEAFWVRGAGDEVPRAARGAEPVAPVAGGGKPKPKPKPKKKMARIG